MKPLFYAVAVGRTRGIYSTWDQCAAQVNGYSGSRFKSFRTLDEARAFLGEHQPSPPSSSPSHSTPENQSSDTASFSSLTRRDYKRRREGEVDVDVNVENDSEAVNTRGHRPPQAQACRVEAAAESRGSCSTSSNSTGTSSLPRVSHHQVVYVDGACSHNGTPHARAGYGGYYGSSSDPRNFSHPVPLAEAQTNNRGELRAVIHSIVQGFVDAGVSEDALGATRHVEPTWLLEHLSHSLHRLVIYTDSRYVIDGLTRYSQKWVDNGFTLSTKQPVQNQDLWKQLIRLRDAYNTRYAEQQYKQASRHPHAVMHGPALPAPPRAYTTHTTRNDESEGIELRHVRGHSNIHGNEMADSLAVNGSRMHKCS